MTTSKPEYFLMRLQGAFTTEAPLACALPHDKPKSKSDPQPFPLIGRQPYYPATGILGAVRRALVRDIREGLTDDGVLPWKVQAYFLNTIGGANGFPKDRKLIPGEDRDLRDANPIESLFGSVRMAGRLGVGNAYGKAPLEDKEELPVMPVVRTLDFERDRGEMEYIKPTEIDRLMKRLALDKANSASKTEAIKEANTIKAQARQATDKDEKARLHEQAKAILEQAKAKRKGGTGAVSIQQALPGYRYLRAGAALENTMIATPVSFAEIGYLLAALRAFSAQPFLGGHRHHGCGLVRAEWAVHGKPARGVGGLRLWGDVQLSLEEGLVVTGDRLLEALAIYDEEREQRFKDRKFDRDEYIKEIEYSETDDDDADEGDGA